MGCTLYPLAEIEEHFLKLAHDPTVSQDRNGGYLYGAEKCIADYDLMKNKCAVVRHCDDHEQTLSEPLWKGVTIGLLPYCKGGINLAHEHSRKYDGYSEDETSKKIERQIKYPPRTCESIARIPGTGEYCTTCLHQGKIKSPIVLGLMKAKPHAFNDKGNAGRLADHLDGNVRYIVESKRFYFYVPDTGLYVPDNDGRITRETLKMVDEIPKEVAGKDKKGVEQVIAWAKQSGNGQRIREAIKLYSSFEGVSLTLETLRADPDAAPCLNGVVDLRTGKLLQPDRSRFYLHQFQVEYDPKAICPLFLAKAIPVWFPDDGTRDWIHRFLGACATGHNVPFFVVNEGGGGEGKTVFTEVISGMWGSFAVHLPVSTLLVKYGINSEDYALAKVKGARILFASEPGERSRLDEAAIKKLTGGDTLTGRFPGGRYFDFPPEHGLILNTNHLLRAGETTHAFWRRVRRVRWTNRIPESAKIDEFAAVLLRDEAPGIWNWILEGAREYYARGLDDIPAEIKRDTDQYRRDQDVLGRWLEECCVPDPSASEPTALLYSSLELWGRENGESDKTKEITLTALGNWLSKHEPPFEKDKNKRPVHRRGLRLADNWKRRLVGSGNGFTVDLGSFESAREDN